MAYVLNGFEPKPQFRTLPRAGFGHWMVLLGLLLSTLPLTAAPMNEHVILLHGLCRTPASMNKMERALTEAGYRVWNVSYPSRTASVRELSDSVLGPAITHCTQAGAERIHFVGHSLGAMLIRDYLARHEVTNAGRVVMLGPPNQGSEIVDKISSWWLFRKINGPAGCELGTDDKSVPAQMEVPNVEIGVIAGKWTINWINSFMLIPGPDDGKVSVERTKLAGMTDHIVLPTSHPFIMKNRTSIRQTIHFLQTGAFERGEPEAK